jgi:hypothetical protein
MRLQNPEPLPMEYTVVLADNKTVSRTDQVEILEAAGAGIRIREGKTEAADAEAITVKAAK